MPDHRVRLVKLMGADFDFSALTEVDDAVREEILDELPPETVAEGVRELDSDDAVRILEDPAQEEQEEILDQLPLPSASRSRAASTTRKRRPAAACRTSSSPSRRTGPLGTRSTTCANRANCRTASTRLYVVDPDQQLLGAVSLDVLLRTKRPVPISELIDEDRRRVHATDDQEEVARMFERYNLLAAPVVDDNDRLVGVITFDDIVDVIEEEAEEDIKALGGVARAEQLSDSVWTIARGRFNWLLVNLGTALSGGLRARRIFQVELQKMVALAVLAPIVASQGGNAATQTMTVAVRALATRELGHANAWRVIVRELTVGRPERSGFCRDHRHCAPTRGSMCRTSAS